MAGNHDLSTAWTKYKDRAYGDEASAKMTQTCWDVEGTFTDKGIKCEATFKGTIVKNALSGIWSASTMCGTKAQRRQILPDHGGGQPVLARRFLFRRSGPLPLPPELGWQESPVAISLFFVFH